VRDVDFKRANGRKGVGYRVSGFRKDVSERIPDGGKPTKVRVD
jgi:hypothetical protein